MLAFLLIPPAALFPLLVTGAATLARMPAASSSPGPSLASSATVSDPAVDGTWLALPPPLRSGPILGYDSFARRLLLTGGSYFWHGGDRSPETWALDLASAPSWNRLETEGEYDGGGASAFLDATRHRLILAQPSGAWVLNTSQLTWTHPIIPNPISYAIRGRAYDPVRDRLLLVGATYNCGSPHHPEVCYVRKVWSWPLNGDSTLVEIATPDSAPLNRTDHSGLYDPARDRLIVFTERFDSMWTLTFAEPAQWDSVPIEGSVPDGARPRWSFYDPSADQIVSYGGIQDIRTLSLSTGPRWEALPAGNPLPPADGPITFDPDQRRLILAAGEGGEVWQYSLPDGEWSRVFRAGPAVGLHSMVMDRPTDRLVVFGGYSPNGTGGGSYHNAVWMYDMAAGAWAPVEPQGSPPAPRAGHTAIVDPSRNRMIVFGGDPVTNETWSLSLDGSPVWDRLTASGEPPGIRWGHSAIYDPVGQRMVVFAGSDGTVDPNGFARLLEDVWSLTLDSQPRWEQLFPAGLSPGKRSGAGSAYDARRRRMVVFGGGGDSSAWALNLAGPPEWHRIESDPLPTIAGGYSACVYDSLADRIIVSGAGERGDEVWQLSLAEAPARWLRLTPGGITPPSGWVPATLFDPDRRRMLVFGGWREGVAVADLASLEWASPAPTPVSVAVVSAAIIDDAIRIIWQARGDAVRLAIERRSAEGPWTARASVLPDGSGLVVFDDQDVDSGERYGYRLRQEGGTSLSFGEVWVDVPPKGVLSLSTPMPVPTAGTAQIRVTLPERSLGVVQIIDVNGRRVAWQSLAGLPPGSHLLSLDLTGVPSGVYMVQVRHGGHSVARRLVVAK